MTERFLTNLTKMPKENFFKQKNVFVGVFAVTCIVVFRCHSAVII